MSAYEGSRWQEIDEDNFKKTDVKTFMGNKKNANTADVAKKNKTISLKDENFEQRGLQIKICQIAMHQGLTALMKWFDDNGYEIIQTPPTP